MFSFLLGHHKVWHGFADIMLSEKKEKHPVGIAKIVTDTSLFDNTEGEEPTAKRAKGGGMNLHYWYLFVARLKCTIAKGFHPSFVFLAFFFRDPPRDGSRAVQNRS